MAITFVMLGTVILHVIFLARHPSTMALDQLTPNQLPSTTHCAFIVSSFGDGEAPEHARYFLKHLPIDCALHHLKIHILGLGDRSYPLFCHFAEQLHTRLLAQGATLSLPLMTVDALNTQDIQLWQQKITQLFAAPAIEPQHYQPPWFNATLIERKHLNPHSSSPGLYKLRFATEQHHWRAGDTVLEDQQRLLDWLAQGATIYVCGSLQGMDRGVHNAMVQLIGVTQMQVLQQQGRYRTDLY